MALWVAAYRKGLLILSHRWRCSHGVTSASHSFWQETGRFPPVHEGEAQGIEPITQTAHNWVGHFVFPRNPDLPLHAARPITLGRGRTGPQQISRLLWFDVCCLRVCGLFLTASELGAQERSFPLGKTLKYICLHWVLLIRRPQKGIT